MISIIIPVYNEEQNLTHLYEELIGILNTVGDKYELIFIDDGSTDDSYETLARLKEKNNNLRIIKMRRNFGQTAALQAGFNNARGDIVISMDADLQNDPKDIPALLDKINEGWDVVCGWRNKRIDVFSKRLFSKISNWLARRITGLRIHDFGCTFRIYRTKTVQDLRLYGELHRFIPAIISWKGYKITEIRVNHRKRQYGKTKYGLARIFVGFLDLLLLKFLLSYFIKPMLMFGSMGLISMFLGGILGVYLLIQKYMYRIRIGDKPLLMLSVLLFIFGLQFICTGLLADMIKRTQYEVSQVYEIEEII